jgi:hypothetical protein
MKKKINAILIVLIFAIAFSACNHKPSVTIKTYIAMDKQPVEGTILKLYVDNEFEGNIPVVKGFDENSTAQNKAFSKDLENGEYEVKLKNANNEILSVAVVNIAIGSRSMNLTGLGSHSAVTKSKISLESYNPDQNSPYKFKCVTKNDAIYLILQ